VQKFEIVYTKTFTDDLQKLIKSDSSLKSKIKNAIEKLKFFPYAGQRVEASELAQRRIWVGDNYRLFYDTEGDKVIILHLKKKDKHTYK
jgi:mRNA-degrading endonuclease RelE of RelBE toxin-antitoxin system